MNKLIETVLFFKRPKVPHEVRKVARWSCYGLAVVFILSLVASLFGWRGFFALTLLTLFSVAFLTRSDAE